MTAPDDRVRPENLSTLDRLVHNVEAQMIAHQASDLRNIETRLLLENRDVDDVNEQLEAVTALFAESRAAAVKSLRAASEDGYRWWMRNRR